MLSSPTMSYFPQEWSYLAENAFLKEYIEFSINNNRIHHLFSCSGILKLYWHEIRKKSL